MKLKSKNPKKSGKKFTWQRCLWLAWGLVAGLLLLLVFSRSPQTVNLRLLKRLSNLVAFVALATFVGSVFELRNWTAWAGRLLKPLVAYAQLPQLVGVGMITALFSNNAAGSLLAGSFAEGRLSRFEMRVGAICNSFVTYVSHSLRVMYPVVGILGRAAISYFALMFGAGLLITLFTLTLCRWRPAGARSDAAEITLAGNFLPERSAGPWPETLKNALLRVRAIIFRVLLITVPLYVLVSYLNRGGFFKAWEAFVPEIATSFFPPEVLAIMAARLGGLVSAAGVAAELHNQGAIGTLHILLALFAGNIITNPLRTLRRNLPTAMGIFPPRDGFFIVMVMQGGRLLLALLYIVGLMFMLAWGW